MKGRAATRRVAFVAIGLGLLGAAILVVNWYIENHYRHVVVEVLHADDRVRVDVDCHRVESEGAATDPQRVDLGWMPLDEPISISDFNARGPAAWEFRLFSNGQLVAPDRASGAVNGSVLLADEFVVTMVESYTATGRDLGEIGCAQPSLVSPAVLDYQQLPVARALPDKARDLPPWSADTLSFELVETAADLVIPFLVAVGFLAALLTPRVRGFLLEPRKGGLAAVAFFLLLEIVQLLLGLGFSGFLAYVEALGLLLLVVTPVVSLWSHTGSQCQDSSSTLSPNQE